MADLKSFVAKWSPVVHSIMRIMIALLFMEHGAQKLFGLPVAMEGFTLSLFSLLGLAAILEFFGGLFVLVGLFTRPVAFILSGQMATAYFMAHAPKSFWPVVNQGELAIIYCFVFLYLAFAGGGSWSLDRALRKID
ncbi:MAG: DoxX family protein [Spirochaetes bacterium RBG_16_49_21]|nr:MAG: DoxX family protein [Spirochaetes bacterium RBG_16_49_21]